MSMRRWRIFGRGGRARREPTPPSTPTPQGVPVPPEPSPPSAATPLSTPSLPESSPPPAATPLSTPSAPEPPPPSVWRNRDFVLLWAAQGISQTVNTGLQFVLLILIIKNFDSSIAGSGLIATAHD